MNRLQLYWELRRQNRLSFHRSPAFEQGLLGKFMSYLMAAIFAIYLIFFGTLMAMAASDDGSYELLPLLLLFLLPVDFALRFVFQQTPSMLVKPYILLPISRYSVVESFLLSSLVSGQNLIWLCMFLPYTIIACCGGFGLGPALLQLAVCWLLVVLGSQFYLLVRSFVSRSLLWLALPVAVYALPFAPLLADSTERSFNHLLDGYAVAAQSAWFAVVVMVAVALMLLLNRHVQFAFIYEELSRQKKTRLRRVSELNFLNRLGVIGEYLKLELKSIMRNKVARNSFLYSIFSTLLFTIFISARFYDDIGGNNFWCFYCFACFGLMHLNTLMSLEGNYMDLLMTHRENILQLLHTKYYLNTAMLLLPLLLMTPLVVKGTFTLLQLVAYLLMVSGPVYMILFQMAVYNKQTLPMEQALTGKRHQGGAEMLIRFLSLALPIAIVPLTEWLLDKTMAHLLLGAFGLAATAAHPWWLRNIYQRMMKRKYENLEGFRATR